MASAPDSSLRQRLALILLPSLVVLLIVSGVLQYLLAVRPMLYEFDRAMVDVAIALADRISINDQAEIVFDLSDEAENLLRADNVDHVWYAAFDDDLRPFAGSRELTWPANAKNQTRHGTPYLFDTVYAGEKVRAVAMKVSCGVVDCGIVLAETTHKRGRLIRDVLLTALLPVLLLGLGAVALLWFGIGRGLQPLVLLSREIGRRSPRDLSAIDPHEAPAEVLPLVEAVNRLMGQLDEAASAQQRFLSTAAHQLRTPLAGLQSQIELAQLEVRDPASRAALADIHASAMRSARLAVQLLSLARVESGASRANALLECDLAQLAAELADEWVPRALARELDLGFELAAAPVRGDPLLLREMMANLLHNAMEYGADGGVITLRTGQTAQQSWFEVLDRGPGIPVAMRDRVLQRFERLPGSRGAGSGLGLAIVKDIADAHQAQLSLLDAAGGRGLCARVSFPVQAAAGAVQTAP